MSTTTIQITAEDTQPAEPKMTAKLKKSDEKWGREVMKLGFSVIPALLLRAQKRLGLNPTQLAVLLQLIDYWWEHDNKPFPSKQALSDRLSLGPRQIQRHIADLEKAGLVQRNERIKADGSKSSNEYDLSGLVKHLKELEPEFREAKEAQRQVSRRGGLSRQKKTEAQ